MYIVVRPHFISIWLRSRSKSIRFFSFFCSPLFPFIFGFYLIFCCCFTSLLISRASLYTSNHHHNVSYYSGFPFGQWINAFGIHIFISFVCLFLIHFICHALFIFENDIRFFLLVYLEGNLRMKKKMSQFLCFFLIREEANEIEQFVLVLLWICMDIAVVVRTM